MKYGSLKESIIKIIYPYMEKDLVDGCLIYNNSTGILFEYRKDEDSSISPEYKGSTNFKVFGHYDISAVLRYIHKKAINISIINNCLYDSDGDFRIELGKKKYGKGNIILPNKPIHFYTNQQEKDLLELLKKLGKN